MLTQVPLEGSSKILIRLTPDPLKAHFIREKGSLKTLGNLTLDPKMANLRLLDGLDQILERLISDP